MENALIISVLSKNSDFLQEILAKIDITQVVKVSDLKQAEKRLSCKDFDLLIVNSPLKEESVEQFVVSLAKDMQVILLVEENYPENLSQKLEKSGVIVLQKPISKKQIEMCLKVMKITSGKMFKIKEKNENLLQKIDDIKIIDRAKCILISSLKMDEKSAHKYVEKQAMDLRKSKREVALSILKTYEN